MPEAKNLKIISTMVCKKIFLIKAKHKKYLCTGCPKSAVRGCKQKSLGYTQPKVGKSQEFSGMGRLTFFILKGKKTQGGVQRPPPHGLEG